MRKVGFVIILIFTIVLFVPITNANSNHKTVRHCKAGKNMWGMTVYEVCNQTFFEYDSVDITYSDADITEETILTCWVEDMSTYNRYISTSQRETKAKGTVKCGLNTPWVEFAGTQATVIRRVYIYGDGSYYKIY